MEIISPDTNGCSATIAKFVNGFLKRIDMGLLFNEDHTAVTGVDKSISEVIIPQGVVFIEKNAFKDCNLLSSIDLPSSLERIADSAFMGCSSLHELDIPKSVYEIGDRVFQDCSQLRSIDLPKGLKYLGEHAFSGCKSLSKIVIPNQIETLKAGLFSGCISLKEVVLPDCLNDIEWDVFDGCPNLSKVSVCSDIFSTSKKDGTVYSSSQWGDLWSYIFCPRDFKGEFTLGGDAYYEAFQYCNQLEAMDICPEPQETTWIWDKAFYGCSALARIRWEGDVFGAFNDGTSVKIGKFAFYDCSSLKRIFLPFYVDRIDEGAFVGTPLKSLYVKWTSPNSKYYLFNDKMMDDSTYDSCILYVPEGTRWEYRHHPAWGKFKNIETYEALPDDLAM